MTNLTAGKLLARNTAWNVIGEGAPLLFAVIAIPRLIGALGTVRFGILTLVWALIGYMSFFDLGIGRALTNLVAQKLGSGEENTLPRLIWTANFLILGIGLLGGAIVASLAHWLVRSVLNIPLDLQSEVIESLLVLSCALPVVISTAGFRGVLEAFQRFDTANAIRIPLGALSYVAPLAAIPFSHSLVPVVLILALIRYIAFIAHFICCRALLPIMRSPLQWNRAAVRPLLSFGGWMTASNLVSPIMAGMDRFLLGALVLMQSVAFYATPYEVVTKLLIIPYAVAGVLFPAFSFALTNDLPRTHRLYRYGNTVIALIMGPLMALVILVAHPGLKIWLGESFAHSSTAVLQILAVGVFFNSLAQPPFALIQGAGKADWTGKLHLAELPFYLIMFWVLTRRFGINGTAAAWTIRVAVDWLALWLMARRRLKMNGSP